MKKKILIIGSRGMLATQVARTFNADKDIDTYVVGRHFSEEVPAANARIFTIGQDKPEFIGMDYIINCAGVIKQNIDTTKFSQYNAIFVNSVFPYHLRAMTSHTPIIQIATDCVFSGSSPVGYDENAPHDAQDVYGKTKSLGEVNDVDFYNIRCSIVGREAFNKKSLLEWFLSQPTGSNVSGYLSHLWNGITTLAFAKVCLAIVKNDIRLPNVTHLVPSRFVSKFELLTYFKNKFKTDHNIIPKNVDYVNRTLRSTPDPSPLWKAAGYHVIPTIQDLIKEIEA